MVEIISTGTLVKRLSAEGLQVTRQRIDGLIRSGRVEAPGLVGSCRAWAPEDVDHVRRVVLSIDGRVRRGGRTRA